MSGCHVTDHQMRLYMSLRQTNPTAIAAAKASISRATGYRIEDDPRLPSQKKQARQRRRPDPLEAVFEAEIVPMWQSLLKLLGLIVLLGVALGAFARWMELGLVSALVVTGIPLCIG